MKEKELWIDDMKVMACCFVVIGHIFQGLTRSGIMPGNFGISAFLWIIYLFHVQIFFMCSGYLYQKGMHVTGLFSWLQNVFRKLIALGIPYFIFAIITWLLRAFAGEAANTDSGSLWDFLFLSPTTAPYWYLYTLFFLFLLIPCIRNGIVMLILLAGFCVLYMFSWDLSFSFILLSLAQYGFWFVLGMAMFGITGGEPVVSNRTFAWGLGFLTVFTCGSTFMYSRGWSGTFTAWTLLFGTLAVFGFSAVWQYLDRGREADPLKKILIRYTFPVYLMHTIFAAVVRSALMALGVMSPSVHLVAGVLSAVLGPVAVAWGFEKLVYPEFLISYSHSCAK